jgi:hypothetical protein
MALRAYAAPLDLTLNEIPDIFSSFITVSYDATNDIFSASGFALEFDDDGVGSAYAIAGGAFQIAATVDQSGVLSPGGTLLLSGTVAGLGFNSGTLLAGTITAFGFRPGGGDPLEFLVDVTGGDAAPMFLDGRAGIILGETGFGGSFAVDFGNTALTEGGGLGAADVAPLRDPPPPEGERGHPGCNRVDCQITLTADQPMYWSVLTGQPSGCQPFTVLDPGFPNGRPDPSGPPGSRMLRGYVLAWAVDKFGEEISWNHLEGTAAGIDYATSSAWETQAYAFQALEADIGQPSDETPGQLNLDGVEYASAFGSLILDFYATGSSVFSNPQSGLSSLLDTDLTLLPMINDLRQDSIGPIATKVKFDIWNQNEVRFSGTERCMECWDQIWLSQFDAPNHFVHASLQTDRGRARVDGIASNLCPFSVDAPLLGVAVKRLVFTDGDRFVGSTLSGSHLRGQGRQTGMIQYDIIERPGEAIGGAIAEGVITMAGALHTTGGLAADATAAAAANDRVSVSNKGSVLVFPKVEIRWDANGYVTHDTFLTLTNDFPGDVAVQLYFVNGDPSLDPQELLEFLP